MAYKFKTNNKRQVSGTTLIAKIVSPDTNSFRTAEYPIVLQAIGISDAEACIRDKQSLLSKLNASNDFDNLTTQVNNMDTQGANGTKITYDFSDSSYIDSTGNVLRRPKFDSTVEEANRFVAVTMTITISKNEAKEVVQQLIIIPMYTAYEVLSAVLFGTTALWNNIKLSNYSYNSIISNLKLAWNDKTEILNLIPEISTYALTSKEANIPALSFDAGSLAFTAGTDQIGITNATGTITRPTFAQMYSQSKAEDNTYTITEVRDTDSDATVSAEERNGSTGSVVAYRISNNSNIKATFTLEDEKIDRTLNAVKVMSNYIGLTEIRNTIINASSISWLIRLIDLTDNKYTFDSKVNSETGIISNAQSENNRVVISTSGEDIILRCPSDITDLTQSADYVINDSQNIGYYTTFEGGSSTAHGFGASSLSFTLKTEVPMTLVTESNIGTWTDNTDNSSYSAIGSNEAEKQYLCIKYSDLPTENVNISLDVNINIPGCSGKHTLYFAIKKV